MGKFSNAVLHGLREKSKELSVESHAFWDGPRMYRRFLLPNQGLYQPLAYGSFGDVYTLDASGYLWRLTRTSEGCEMKS
jgi:hypothetical protein